MHLNVGHGNNMNKGDAMVKDCTNANKGGEHSYQHCRQWLGVQILEGGNKGYLECLSVSGRKLVRLEWIILL